MSFEILSKHERRKLLAELKENFGIEKQNLNYLFLKAGKEKIRAFSGSLSREEISALARVINIELIGIYFAKQQGNEIRLSHDAVSLLRKEISKNIIEMDDDEAEKWLRGEEIDKNSGKGVVILKHKDDLIGTGKSNGEFIFNFVPKERRIKN